LLGPLAFGGRGWIYLLALLATLLSSFLGTARSSTVGPCASTSAASKKPRRRPSIVLRASLEAVERYRAAAEAREQALFPPWEAMRARPRPDGVRCVSNTGCSIR